jgi:hypothetical protein
LPSLKSLKKGAGYGSISQRYRPGDPDTHQNVTGPQHSLYILFSVQLCILLPVKAGQVHDTLGVGEAGEVGLMMTKMLAGVVRVLLMTLGETGKKLRYVKDNDRKQP